MENHAKSNPSNMKEESMAGNRKAMDDQRLRKIVSSYEILLRILVLLLTLIASILVGINKETKIIPITIMQTLPPLQVPITAKWQYLSASVFFLVSNTIACSYAAGSIIYSMAAKSRRRREGKLAMIILDMMVTNLLFSANGATTAIGVIGRYGNSHTGWNKVCNVFPDYCNHMIAALVLSFLATVICLFLVVIAIFNLYEK